MPTLLFLWGVLSIGYAPGALLLRLLERSLTRIEHVSLSLTFGLVVSAAVYWLVAVMGYPAFFVAWPLGAVGLLLYLRRRDVRSIRLELDRAYAALLAVLALGVVVLVKLPLFFGNLTIASDGGMTVVPISDALLHVAIANELTHTIPPQNPVFAGQALSYHYGMDLVAAMMARGTGLTVADLTVRFVPMLLMGTGMLTAFCFSRRWLGSIGFAALTVLLVFFGEDFSFVPGFMHGWTDDWTTAFNVPAVFSLFFVNPMLPAVGLLFAGLFCLQKYLDAPDYAWLLLSAICFAALAEVKVFTAAHVLGSLGAAALVYAVFARRFELLKVTLVTAALTAPFLLNTLLKNQAGAQIEVIPGPAGYVEGAMQRLGLPVTGAPALLAIGLPLFLFASLGLRVAGAWPVVKTLVRPVGSSPLRFTLAFFVIAGIALTLMLRVLARGQGGYDNGVWFFVQSKYVAWIFAVEVLQRWYVALRSAKWAPVLAGTLIVLPAIALAAPSSVQHFTVLAKEAAASDPAATDAARVVASKAHPGDVVLANQAVMARVLAFAPVRLPVGYYADTLVSKSRFAQHESLVLDFWRAWDSGISRTDIPRYLRVRYVSAAKRADVYLPSDVKQLYSNSDYVVFELPVSP